MSGKTYNGWTNYETWCLFTWMSNDEGSYKYWVERARSIVEADGESVALGRRAVSRKLYAIAEAVKDDYYENTPEVSGFYSDMIHTALGEVDWHKIAEHLVAAVEAERV